VKLIREADVLVENFAPGAMDRMGLGWDHIHELNPRLIFGSVKGFNDDSPWKHGRGTPTAHLRHLRRDREVARRQDQVRSGRHPAQVRGALRAGAGHERNRP
jgi:hypothetical protein